MYDQYIGADLHQTDKDEMKRTTIVCRRLRNTEDNTESTGNYRTWEDHTEYEMEFCDVSISKITTNIIAENMLSQREGTFSYLKKYVITGRIGMKYQRGSDSLYQRMATRTQKV